METSLKTGFAQNFSRCPKNLSCPKIWGGCSPPRPPDPYAYVYKLYLQYCLFTFLSWSGTFFFTVIPFYRPGKFPLNYRWSSGGPEKTQKCCFIYFLTGSFQKLFVNHIGVLFFPVKVYFTIGDKRFIYVAVPGCICKMITWSDLYKTLVNH